ncbi:hypothetical protein FRC07_001938 [Ceratobasidium sp. 392]|nr:hypothetical protein FRC07_001938 [Ceratobasidium sp. 392]
MSHKAPAIPLELIQHIAKHCAVPELLSLVVLDRSCHNGVLPVLYRDVQLQEYENSFIFCHTVCTKLEGIRNSVRSIDIRLYEEPDLEYPSDDEDEYESEYERKDPEKIAAGKKRDKDLGVAVANTLALVPNLTHLTLEVWREEVFGPIFTHDQLPYPFQLKSLRVPILDHAAFESFLRQQGHIEELELAWSWGVNAREFLQSSRCEYSADVLPRLRNLRVESHPLVGLRLMKNRAISTVALRVSQGDSEHPELPQLLVQGSISLTRLELSTFGHPNSSNERLSKLLAAINTCQDTLEHLTIVRNENFPYELALASHPLTKLSL